MSFVTRRALSTLIPPKIASAQAIGSAPNAARMQRIIKFYNALPRGPAPQTKPSGLLQRYRDRYFGDKPSPAPILHFILFFITFGYIQQYYFHLRHHKNNAH